jgi:Ca2+-binding RTX toxin-like protein
MRRAAVLAGAAVLLLSPVRLADAQPPDTCFGDPVNDGRATDDDDFLSGSDGPDVIALGTGADQAFMGLDDDSICGNGGADLLAGEAGADRIDGGQGEDQLLGMMGPDTLRAGPGSDTLEGGGGGDTVAAAVQDDQRDDLFDGPGADVIIGRAEDTWWRCVGDEATDDHSDFSGNIVPDQSC